MAWKGREVELPFRRVLLAVDGSRSSREGIEAALSLVRAMGSQITIVHVIPPSPGQVDVGIPTEAEKSAESIISRAQDAFAREGIKARTDLVKYGEPHSAIVQLAKEGWCDLLVIGSCGDEGWGVYPARPMARSMSGLSPSISNSTDTTEKPDLLLTRRTGPGKSLATLMAVSPTE